MAETSPLGEHRYGCARFPRALRTSLSLDIVLDHLGKPPLSGSLADIEGWEGLIREAAARPNVHAKVSGLYASEGRADGWTSQRVSDMVEAAFHSFGADRVMYGGNWPMSIMAGGYDRVFSALRDAVSRFSSEDQERFFWRNAAVFYQLRTAD